MKKIKSIILLILLSFNFGYSQILNYDFEIWEPLFGNENLEHWNCNGLSFGACTRVEITGMNNAVRMDNSLPCVDLNDPSQGASLGNGDLTQFFKVPSSNFTLSYDLVIDSLDMPAEFQIRLINPGIETVFETTHSEFINGKVIHEISIDSNVDSLLIKLEPIGFKKEMAEHDCDKGYISIIIDNLVVETTVSTTEIKKNYSLIYPNPSSGVIFLQNSKSKIRVIEVYDSQGRMFKNIQDVSSNYIELDLNGLTGLIYLKIVDENDKVESSIIVIR